MPRSEDLKKLKPGPTKPPEIRDEWTTKRELLSMTLALAVPMWADKMKHNSWDYLIQRAKVCSDHIAEHGDIILFKSKKKGETAEAFNRLAEGIACLSFAPGGIKMWGNHWESVLDTDGPKRLVDVLSTLAKSLEQSMKGNPDETRT